MTIARIRASEVRNRIGDILARVRYGGEHMVVERRGQPVAVIIGIEEIAAQAHLRIVRRYLEGSLERRPSDLELCAWIRFCYRREFYAEAVAFFPYVDETRVDPEEYRRVREIVEVCRLRSD